MSRILSLSSGNFLLSGRQKKTLNINIPGNVLVFFKTMDCPGCREFEPMFGNLSRADTRVVYAIIDVSVHRDVVTLSRETSMPIQSVPTLVLYTSGRPFAKFTGKKNEQAISSFITKALQSIPNTGQQQFMGQPPQGIPQAPPQLRYPDIPNHQVTGLKNQKGLPPAVEDDDTRLSQPDGIIPHNIPWKAEYQKLQD